MATRALLIAILLLTACSGSEPNDPDAGLEAPDGGSCGTSPGAICPSVSCYLCENQGKENCGSVCMKHECWTCTDGGWQRTAVDCVADCT